MTQSRNSALALANGLSPPVGDEGREVVATTGVVVVVVGATVVVGVAVVVDAVVVVGAAVVVGVAVVVAATVVVGVAVVAGVAVSELPPHPEATNKNVRTTVHFLIPSVCHPFP